MCSALAGRFCKYSVEQHTEGKIPRKALSPNKVDGRLIPKPPRRHVRSRFPHLLKVNLVLI
jgi:hypothetical protein